PCSRRRRGRGRRPRGARGPSPGRGAGASRSRAPSSWGSAGCRPSRVLVSSGDPRPETTLPGQTPGDRALSCGRTLRDDARPRRALPPGVAAERGRTTVGPAAPGPPCRTTPGNDEALASVSAGQGFVSEPPVGIEPTTYSLRVNRSAD